jgi:hypothetical protein
LCIEDIYFIDVRVKSTFSFADDKHGIAKTEKMFKLLKTSERDTYCFALTKRASGHPGYSI